MRETAWEPPALEKRILEAPATPRRPGVRKIAARFGVNPETVQRISRPFVAQVSPSCPRRRKAASRSTSSDSDHGQVCPL
jgi:hypothetical protein